MMRVDDDEATRKAAYEVGAARGACGGRRDRGRRARGAVRASWRGTRRAALRRAEGAAGPPLAAARAKADRPLPAATAMHLRTPPPPPPRQALRSIGPFVAERFCEIVKARNALARLSGYEDFYDMSECALGRGAM
jgi:hypothetical protein